MGSRYGHLDNGPRKLRKKRSFDDAASDITVQFPLSRTASELPSPSTVRESGRLPRVVSEPAATPTTVPVSRPPSRSRRRSLSLSPRGSRSSGLSPRHALRGSDGAEIAAEPRMSRRPSFSEHYAQFPDGGMTRRGSAFEPPLDQIQRSSPATLARSRSLGGLNLNGENVVLPRLARDPSVAGSRQPAVASFKNIWQTPLPQEWISAMPGKRCGFLDMTSVFHRPDIHHRPPNHFEPGSAARPGA